VLWEIEHGELEIEETHVPVADFCDHPDFGADVWEHGKELQLGLGQNLHTYQRPKEEVQEQSTQ